MLNAVTVKTVSPGFQLFIKCVLKIVYYVSLFQFCQGNTVLHYAISHGNLDIVELLLGIDELNADRANQAGYTAAMLAALCQIKTTEESRIIKRLFAVRCSFAFS